MESGHGLGMRVEESRIGCFLAVSDPCRPEGARCYEHNLSVRDKVYRLSAGGTEAIILPVVHMGDVITQ